MELRKIVSAAINGVMLITFFLCVPHAFAASRSVFGTYSSLKYNNESGDLLGYEVLIIPTDVGLKAIVQVAEGSPGQVYIVRVVEKGGNISFDIPLSSGIRESFSGRVEGSYLIGDVFSPGGKEHVELKRGMSYWDKQFSP